MIEATIRRGTLLAVGVLILCTLGVIAALRVPVQMIPDLEVSKIEVDTRWPYAGQPGATEPAAVRCWMNAQRPLLSCTHTT